MAKTRRVGIRALLSLALGVTLAAGAALGGSTASAQPSESRSRFIITLAEGVDSRSVAQDYRRGGAQIDFVYTAALNGFAGAMAQADLGALQRDRRVTRIERDGIATASDTQINPTWGLDRIDARRGLDKAYTYAATGAGVTAYIIDTGIRYGHSEFGTRASFGYDTFGGDGSDCNGHGTHVAGTVGGSLYGVAKAARLVAVRVLDCSGSGTWSGVIAGMDWVTSNHTSATPAVANMSLGGGASVSVDEAVKRMIADGVTTVVAAGNGNQGGKEQDACNYSPARVPDAVTIGATTSSDSKTSWSNFGPCVDFFAPGASITSAWYTGDAATNTISGTSMAAPHAAGVAALYLQGAATATPQTVRDAMYAATTKNVVTSSRTANNDLLYSRFETGTVVQNGTLSGTVTTPDSSGGSAAVAGAVISVSPTNASATTGPNGSYTLSLAPETYEVTVTADGYEATTATVAVTSAQATTQNFSLTRSNSTEPSSSFGLLLAAADKVKGTTEVASTWSDSGYSGEYDVFVNGSFLKTVIGTSETTGWKGGGVLTYQVCRSRTEICSVLKSITI